MEAERASDLATGFGSASKTLRMALQSAALGVGAFLVVRGEATGGVIIAGSILAGRALAPIEQMIAPYKGFVAARQSWKRISDVLAAFPEREETLKLPCPSSLLTVKNLRVSPPGTQRVTLQGVTFALKAGEGVGVIGPSASGKSSLARALVGVWKPARGSVRLDGAAIEQWSHDELGAHLGYLPQDIELFDGTIAQYIACFDPQAAHTEIVLAAERAGVHEMIVRQPHGYERRIGAVGTALSGGQRQRLGVARALYGNPFLLVLDEPNSNLDSEGEQALSAAVMGFRERGVVVVMIAHRPSALACVDQVLVLANGEAKVFGPKDQVLRPPSPANLRPVNTTEKSA